MTSTQIDYFLSAARHLSFTRAAKELYTSQPTVSRQIAMLEAEVGLPQFKRSGKKLSLTPEGEMLNTELTRSRQIVHTALYRARQLQSGLSGRLSIGCLTVINTSSFVVPPITSFAKANRNVDLSIEMGSFSVLRDRLERGVCDVVFSLGFDLAAYEGVEHMICYRPRPLLVFPASHPLASRADCAVSDFADDIFLLPDPAECFGRGNILKEILARFGIPDAKVGYVRNSESVLLGVLAGRGVAILTACHRCTADTRYRTIPIPDDGAQPTPAVVAIWKKDNANPIIPAFLQTLEDLILIPI